MNTKATILIIDPDKASYIFLEELLLIILPNADNYQILNTAYGKEAIEMCQKQKPDLVFTKIRLKDLDGFQVIRKLKKLYPEIPIITETIIAESNFEQKAWQAGCDGFLTKPLDLREMDDLIKALF